jgi:hypothetical protein
MLAQVDIYKHVSQDDFNLGRLSNKKIRCQGVKKITEAKGYGMYIRQ